MTAPYILMADDNASDIDLFAEAVRSVGHAALRVVGASDGRQAWNFLSAIPLGGALPRLVILDLHLPHISGPEFTARMKRADHLQQVPTVIISSGWSTASEGRHADACFEKPGEWAEFIGLARILCRSYIRDGETGGEPAPASIASGIRVAGSGVPG